MNSLPEKQKGRRKFWLIAFIIATGGFLAMAYAYYSSGPSHGADGKAGDGEMKYAEIRKKLDSAISEKETIKQELEKVRQELARAEQGTTEADSARVRVRRLVRKAEIAKREAQLEALKRKIKIRKLKKQVGQLQSNPPSPQKQQQQQKQVTANPLPAKNEAEQSKPAGETSEPGEPGETMYQAIARLLGYKAQLDYDDKQLNYLLARQAREFNKEYGNFERVPSIFGGLRHAWKRTGINNAYTLDSKEVVTSMLSAQDSVFVLADDGALFQFARDNKTIDTPIKQLSSIYAINDAFFVSENLLVISYANKSMRLWDFRNNRSTWLREQSGYIRGALYNPQENKLYTAGRDKVVREWDVGFESQTRQANQLQLDTRINGLAWCPDKRRMVIAGNDGKVMCWNPENEDLQVMAEGNSRTLDVDVAKGSGLIAAGYSDGNVKLLLANGKKGDVKTIKAADTGVESVKLSQDSKILAITSEWGMKIRLFTLSHLDQDPVIFNGSHGSVQDMHMRDRTIYALYNDNKLRFWPLDAEGYMEVIEKHRDRGFTKAEWKKYVSNSIPYPRVQ